jgi:tripartite-type tricarboxylate transporter receptor subunit TctC
MDSRTINRGACAFGVLWFALCGLVAAQTSSGSQPFPSRAVRLIVPAPPGTAPDIRARQIAQKLAEDWQQPVVVDNRPGASGNIAMESAARAPNDGHTLVMGNISYLAILPHLAKLAVDSTKELVPVSKVTAGPLVLVAHPGVPFNSVAELISHARAHPGKLNSSGGGIGSTNHLAVILLNKITGIDTTFNPPRQELQPPPN